MSEKPLIQGIYRHFKGNLYQVKCLATDSETGEELVVYQALYGDYKYYVRPLDMFMSPVDRAKYPNADQKFRFERYDQEDTLKGDKGRLFESSTIKEEISRKQGQTVRESESQTATVSSVGMSGQMAEDKSDKAPQKSIVQAETEASQENTVQSEAEAPQIDPDVLDFLDAETYDMRLEILGKLKYKITNDMIDIMSTVIDIDVPEGDAGERYEIFKEALVTRRHYECSRLRGRS